MTAPTSAKDYVLALLDAFLEDRPLAKGLKILVESGNMDDKMLEGLAKIFESVVHDVAVKHKHEKFEKGLAYLQKVRSLEESTHEETKTSLDEMLEGI